MTSTEAPDHIDITPVSSGGKDFDALIGSQADFYGVDNNCFKLDGVIYEAIEDESDGYRSLLGCIEVRDAQGKIFFAAPLARVIVKHADNTREGIYTLIDANDGHEWLRFGTDDYDDWYPMFIFTYTPKGPAD